jgi:hypothetical protein
VSLIEVPLLRSSAFSAAAAAKQRWIVSLTTTLLGRSSSGNPVEQVAVYGLGVAEAAILQRPFRRRMCSLDGPRDRNSPVKLREPTPLATLDRNGPERPTPQ